MRSQEEMPEPPWQMVGGVTKRLGVAGLPEEISYARPETPQLTAFRQPRNKDRAGEKGPAALQDPGLGRGDGITVLGPSQQWRRQGPEITETQWVQLPRMSSKAGVVSRGA